MTEIQQIREYLTHEITQEKLIKFATGHIKENEIIKQFDKYIVIVYWGKMDACRHRWLSNPEVSIQIEYLDEIISWAGGVKMWEKDFYIKKLLYGLKKRTTEISINKKGIKR